MGAKHETDHPHVPAGDIRAGVRFSTLFESGCVAHESPNADGGFLAADSDGVVCWFSVVMVVSVEEES